MTTQTKTLSILGLAALAAGLLGTAQPALAAGLAHPMTFTRTATLADHDDWNNRDRDNRSNDRRDFRREQEARREFAIRREQEFRRQEEFRREQERRHDGNRDFRSDNRHDDGSRDFQGDR